MADKQTTPKPQKPPKKASILARIEQWDKLEANRIVRGHTIAQVVEEIGISKSLWYVWKQGKGKPRRAHQRAAERYVRDTSAEE